MKQLSIILLAAIFALSSCKKDEDESTPSSSDNFKGSYSLNMDGQSFSKKLEDVLYVTDYNRIQIQGEGLNKEIFALYINNIPSSNNQSFSCTNGTITLTYDGVMYSTGSSNSGTITRKSSTKVIFENIVASDFTGSATKTFSGEANIGRETTL